jgi:hypothetical protein
MRYYLAQCEYKWTHVDTDMETLWVRRELGDELYKTVETNGWDLQLLRTSSTSLPGDIYCRCDIYLDVPDGVQATLFALKFPQATATPLAHNV